MLAGASVIHDIIFPMEYGMQIIAAARLRLSSTPANGMWHLMAHSTQNGIRMSP